MYVTWFKNKKVLLVCMQYIACISIEHISFCGSYPQFEILILSNKKRKKSGKGSLASLVALSLLAEPINIIRWPLDHAHGLQKPSNFVTEAWNTIGRTGDHFNLGNMAIFSCHKSWVDFLQTWWLHPLWWCADHCQWKLPYSLTCWGAIGIWNPAGRIWMFRRWCHWGGDEAIHG